MSGFHESLDAALGRAGERDDDRYVPGADDATNLGLLIFTDATPGGTDRIIKRILASDWLAQRIEQAKAEAEREVLDRLGEAAGQYHDVLDREIADSLRRDREYVEAHDRAVKAEERERIASAIIARNVLHHGKDRRDDCLCLCCSSFRDAARIAREVPHA